MLTGLILSILIAVTPVSPELFKQYGTESEACVRALHQGITLANEEKPEEALPHILAALEADPESVMAAYWHATILARTNQSDAATARFAEIGERAYRNRETKRPSIIEIDSLNRVGTIEGGRGEHEKAMRRFTQILEMDPTNHHRYRALIYRNLAVGNYDLKKYAAAFFCAQQHRCLETTDNSVAMAAHYAEPLRLGASVLGECDVNALLIALAQNGKLPDTTTTLLTTNLEQPAPLPPHPGSIPKFVKDTRWEEKLPADMHLADVVFEQDTNRCFLFWHKHNEFHRIDFETGDVKAFPVEHWVRCAAIHGDNLYLGLKKMGGLLVYSSEGEKLRQMKLPGVPEDVVVCPETNLVFVTVQDMVHVLNPEADTGNGLKIPGQRVAIDPARRMLYILHQPKDASHIGESGRIPALVRHVQYGFQPNYVLWSNQAVLISMLYDAQGNATLVSVRSQVAAAGHGLALSPDQRWVAVTGGGGYRGPGPQGYGVATFASNDLSHLSAMYLLAGNPQAFAFSNNGNFVAGLSKNSLRLYKSGSPAEFEDLSGTFGSVVAWSPDDQFLIVANSVSGVNVFKRPSSAEEVPQ